MADQVQVAIIDGKSKFDLNTRFAVFVVESQGEVDGLDVCLTGLEKEDGSGERWIFHGFTKARNTRINGHYSTETRKGHMIIG